MYSADDNALIALYKLAHNVSFLACVSYSLNSLVSVVLVNNNDHTNTHIEGVEHISLGDLSCLCDKVEDRKHLNCASVDLSGNSCRKRTGNVLIESAACDVAEGLYLDGIKQAHYSLYVYLCGSQQALAEGSAKV